jgi:hypothetical protein
MRMVACILFCWLISSPAFAQYQEVNGTPRVTVAGRTLGVWAAENPIGDILGIFERGPDGVWRGLCLASPGYPTLDEAVKSAGGPTQYVDSQLARLNTCLSQAFGVSFDDTARGRINAALAQYFTLTPQPALARK